MGFLKEFKEFSLRGNVIDLAIAVIIGAAFSAIVSSLIEDVITPLLLTPALTAAGVQDLSQLMWGAVKWGKFLAAVLKFLMVALVLFVFVKGINKLRRAKDVTANAAPAVPELSVSEKLLMEIRDSVRK